MSVAPQRLSWWAGAAASVLAASQPATVGGRVSVLLGASTSLCARRWQQQRPRQLQQQHLWEGSRGLPALAAAAARPSETVSVQCFWRTLQRAASVETFMMCSLWEWGARCVSEVVSGPVALPG
jgi:hypothetical protein